MVGRCDGQAVLVAAPAPSQAVVIVGTESQVAHRFGDGVQDAPTQSNISQAVATKLGIVVVAGGRDDRRRGGVEPNHLPAVAADDDSGAGKTTRPVEECVQPRCGLE